MEDSSLRHRVARKFGSLARRAKTRIDQIGPAQSEAAIVAASNTYWRDPSNDRWKADSHWHDGIPGEWSGVGAEHLALFERLVRV
ncbi:MAG: hypothetical protein QM662_19635, partial [Gordonia sp. (in: high G+C Gram-positive bacteria)]